MNVPHKYGLGASDRRPAEDRCVSSFLILGLFGLLGSLVYGDRMAFPRWLTLGGAVAAPLVALIIFVQLYAFGSILSLLVKIEENTRAMIPPGE